LSLLLGFAALAFTIIAYFAVRHDHAERADTPEGWYQFFFKNSFSFSLAVLAVAGAIVLAGFIRRRAFCNCLCPVGTVSELYLQSERWTKKGTKK
jgi:polyferredoxin